MESEWIELIPAGSFRTNDGRGPFYNYTPAEVISLSRIGAPVDFDHATDRAAPKGLPAPAAGWIREYRIVAGAIQGRIEWTPRGAAALKAKEYRFISPVFHFEPPEGAGDVTMGRVIAIARAGLVNSPALDQLPALAASRVVQLSALEQDALMAAAINAEIERQLGPLVNEVMQRRSASQTGTQTVELTDAERTMCWAFGNSESEFLALKAKARRSIIADRNDAAAARAQFGPSRITVAELCARRRS